MRTCSCGLLFAAGICSCGLAIAGAETAEYKRPSAPACLSPRSYRDFGPPSGCDTDTLPHNRMGWMTSVAGTSTVSGAMFVTVPMVAYTFRDLEEAAAAYDGFIKVAKYTNSGWPPIIDNLEGNSSINLVRPTRDERRELIRDITSKNEAI
jgi:hypothetical protein